MRRLTIFLLCLPLLCAAQHPVAFATRSDLAFVRSGLSRYPVLKTSYAEIKASVDPYLGKDVDVPVPKDPAGGYTHDRHKENYMLMFNAGLLYNITNDNRYASLVKSMFLKYARLNPGLKNHPQATSSSPGRIFWQALNDANWLVYTGLAYDLIYNSLSPAERKDIEENAFRPEVDFLTKDLESWFNLIHNHGVWACAGVGIVGIATNNKAYVDMALRGTRMDGKSGFLAQLDNLFSPDGYYTEGPYYVRYALLPFYLFANALDHARPELKIFQYRDHILQKALVAGLQQTNTNGRFFPMNDALKEKDFTTNEMVTAIDIARSVYGKDLGQLSVARRQERVLLHRGGALVASELQSEKNIPLFYPYSSVEYADGAKGDEGGISLLRSGKGERLTTLFFKYASHGLSHGHFDRLGYFLFDNGNEILQDYGSVRFIGVEQKFGGRYLPENKTYAGQTIAHNTVVVDESSHFDGKEAEAEKTSSQKTFSDISRPEVQAVGAVETRAYKDADLRRNIYMLRLPGKQKPLLIDIFNIRSQGLHQYDLPFQYSGNLISTSFKYKAATSSLNIMGKKNGYQFLWKEAEASVKDSMAQFTFLNDAGYYTISSLVADSATIFFTRLGANDPDFNLRRETSYIIRKTGKGQDFVSVIEMHGNFDPINEFSTGSYSSVKSIRLLRNDGAYTVAQINYQDKMLIVAQSNTQFRKEGNHSLVAGELNLEWTGPYGAWYDGKKL